MVDGRRSRAGFTFDVGLRGWLVLGLVVVGLLLLMAPPALAAFALLTLLATPAAWKLSDRLARRLPEEDDGRGRRER